MQYNIFVNNQNLSNYCFELPENSNGKEKLEAFLLPKYEFKFSNINLLKSFENIYLKNIPVRLSTKNEILISGNILEISKDLNLFKIVIGSDNDRYKELTNIGTWINQNPAKIIYDIASYFDININEIYYKKTFAYYENNNIKLSFFPDDSTSFIDFINEMKKYTDMDIYISNNELYIDTLNDKDNVSIFLTDKNIISASVKAQSKTYTNYSFKSIDSNDVEITDSNSNNLFQNERDNLGDISFDSIDGSSTANLQIPTKEVGIFLQEKRLEYYSIVKREFEITLPISFDFVQLDDVISWESNAYNINNTFEIIEKTIKFTEAKIILTIRELSDSTAIESNNSGFGVTPFGVDYGN